MGMVWLARTAEAAEDAGVGVEMGQLGGTERSGVVWAEGVVCEALVVAVLFAFAVFD